MKRFIKFRFYFRRFRKDILFSNSSKTYFIFEDSEKIFYFRRIRKHILINNATTIFAVFDNIIFNFQSLFLYKGSIFYFIAFYYTIIE